MAEPTSSPLGELITLLVQQARALDVVDHRVAAVSLLVSAREGRFLSAAADELEAAAAILADLEAEREEVAIRAARQLGVATQSGVRLRSLAAAAAGPERAALDSLGERLSEVTERIASRMDEAAQSTGLGLRALRDVLERHATGSRGTLYGRDGGGSALPPPSRFDELA